jgi:hypothetical protein
MPSRSSRLTGEPRATSQSPTADQHPPAAYQQHPLLPRKFASRPQRTAAYCILQHYIKDYGHNDVINEWCRRDCHAYCWQCSWCSCYSAQSLSPPSDTKAPRLTFDAASIRCVCDNVRVVQEASKIRVGKHILCKR